MPAAYSLSRFDFPGRGPLALLILGTQMLPVVAILVPLVVIIRSLGLINTLTALVFTHLALGLPVAAGCSRATSTPSRASSRRRR